MEAESSRKMERKKEKKRRKVVEDASNPGSELHQVEDSMEAEASTKKQKKRRRKVIEDASNPGSEPHQVEDSVSDNEASYENEEKRLEILDQISQTIGDLQLKRQKINAHLDYKRLDDSETKLKSKKKKRRLDDSETKLRSKKKKIKRLDDSETKLRSKKKKIKRLDDSETKLRSKKKKKIKCLDDSETKEKSKELKKTVSEDLKKIQTNPDLPKCGFAVPEAQNKNWGNNNETFFVKGFDSNLPRDCIKKSLEEHFSSCGEIRRVFVPVDCETGARLGYAFINLEKRDDVKKALALNGSDLGRRKLEVVMAKDRDEFYCYPFPNSKGCSTCRIRDHLMRIYRTYYATNGGRMMTSGFLTSRFNLFPFPKKRP